jgi:excisionase family DNA binding protein
MGQKVPIKAASEVAGVCDKTLRRYIAEGLLPAYRVGPKLIRIDLDDLEELLKPIGGAA